MLVMGMVVDLVMEVRLLLFLVVQCKYDQAEENDVFII